MITRHVNPGREAAFEELVRQTSAAAARFPGAQGVQVLRPDADKAASREYAVVFTFDSAQHADAWERSPERADLYARLGEVAVESTRHRASTGIDSWFTLPWSSQERPPVRWRMAVLLWAFIWPATTALNTLTDPLLTGAPLPVHTLVGATVLVPLMTYVALPRLTRLLHAWLQSGST